MNGFWIFDSVIIETIDTEIIADDLKDLPFDMRPPGVSRTTTIGD